MLRNIIYIRNIHIYIYITYIRIVIQHKLQFASTDGHLKMNKYQLKCSMSCTGLLSQSRPRFEGWSYGPPFGRMGK